MSDVRMTFMCFSALLGMALWTSLAGGQDLLRDPTRPPASLAWQTPATPDAANALFELSAVIFADGRRLAIINGERVKEQDRIGTARVVRIAREGVRLERSGELIELRLVPHDVKDAADPKLLGRASEAKVGDARRADGLAGETGR